MIYTGKVQLTVITKSPPELEAEGVRIFASHANWIEANHYSDGDKALLQYNVAKGSDCLCQKFMLTSRPGIKFDSVTR